MKLNIKNRKGEKLVILIDAIENQKGLVFVMHGLGGNKEKPTVKALMQGFVENNLTCIRFDTTNSFGESDGEYEKATVTNYSEDLEDVIEWAKTQPWYQEPFYLTGHSLGGMSILLYAEKYPEKVKGLVPASSVISGELSLDTERYKGNDILKNWKETGWYKRESYGKIKNLPWSHMEDRFKYNILENANKLTMPVLLIVGELDDGCPPKHQKLLYEKLPGKRELHIVKGAPHSFDKKEEHEDIIKTIKEWLVSILTS
jgi:uncharacterized protein